MPSSIATRLMRWLMVGITFSVAILPGRPKEITGREDTQHLRETERHGHSKTQSHGYPRRIHQGLVQLDDQLSVVTSIGNIPVSDTSKNG